MNANNAILDILSAPLSPAWTIEALVEQMLGAIAAAQAEEQEFVLDADAAMNGQARRLLRPLLASLAVTSAAEAGTVANLYGGHLLFQRRGPHGPVWILGHFENQPGNVRVALRRSSLPPEDVAATPDGAERARDRQCLGS